MPTSIEDRPLRVVMVLEGVFPSPRGGGAEAQVATLGRYLAARGVQVRVVTPLVPHGPSSSREEVEGLEVWRFRYPRLRRLGGLFLVARVCASLLRTRREYDAIHAHIGHHMAAASCLVGKLVGKPVVVKLTGSHEMENGMLAKGRAGLLTVALRWCFRRASALQATSQRIETRLLECGFARERIHRIPNAVDVARFSGPADRSGLRRELGLTASTLGVFVGRFVPEKGLLPFLGAWRRALGARPEVALLLVGEGVLEAELRAEARASGLLDSVVFAGARTDVERFLAAADFAVLPSLHEGLSNSLLEYMAAGLPVLASRVSGTEDLVATGETGWLCEPGEPATFERSLREIADAPPARLQEMGRKARERVRDYAATSLVAARLAELYGVRLPPPSSAVASEAGKGMAP